MRRVLQSVFLITFFLVAGIASVASAQEGQALAGLSAGSSADYYQALINTVSGEDWGKYGGLFTMLQGEWFWKIFLAIITVVPGVFLLHYLIIGAKHFDHGGQQILFFPLFIRLVHLVAAVSMSVLVVTGLMEILGTFLGGGALVRTARTVHLVSAMVFVVPCFLMLVVWLKDMLPKFYDLKWMLILGGYLSKEKKPVPAAKFNAGQKMYFWFVTFGGLVMAYSGYLIWEMNPAALDQVRIFTIVHNVLGMGIVAFYLTHVYMSVFAIAGSLESIKTGYKPKAEVDILHSLYKY